MEIESFFSNNFEDKAMGNANWFLCLLNFYQNIGKNNKSLFKVLDFRMNLKFLYCGELLTGVIAGWTAFSETGILNYECHLNQIECLA